MKKLTLVVLLFLTVLTACGDKDEAARENGEDNETLVVGTTHASPPNAFVDDETEKVNGVMIDIIKEIAERNDYQLKFEPMPFSSLIPSLDSSRVDVISAGMGITDERAKTVSFTQPVYGFSEALVVPAGNKDNIKSLKDLKNQSVGVSAGTFYHDYLEESNVSLDVKAYDTTSEMLLDLTKGRIKGAINDTPIVHYLNENNSKYDVETVKEYEPNFKVEIGVIVNQENEKLLNEIDKTIGKMKEDGTLESIHEEWGTTWFKE
ncbi:substrate-binding periplasmic protein [Lentibacillus cibarius]|uniref:Amino acid ABC transporter substrate-binding protein n=1 Tax=Lentibacillus cibarius TaxID=2583219 RepID=A0A5S3QIR1_9BACI|nr:ABC transporter substrate-binding protein [Lentibacillus cibarius]TMN21812.1 amino acid ABC transporter substrate-binding protein [Lentibacillus cibarius]